MRPRRTGRRAADPAGRDDAGLAGALVDDVLAAASDAAPHRPWPMPARPWAMAMTWHDLLFLHWPVAPQALEAFIPPPLRLDTFDGRAWLGVVPFRMSGIHLHGVPPIPGAAAFPEINVRTYAVAPDGRTGVWFFSLDATSRLAVRAARAWFGLPYFDARIEAVAVAGHAVRYASTRTHRAAPSATFAGRYGPTGPVALASPGTLDHWLTERYALFTVDRRGRVGCGEIHHAPWPLQPAAADIDVNTMAVPIGVALPSTAPLAHFARRLDVVAWTIRTLGVTTAPGARRTTRGNVPSPNP